MNPITTFDLILMVLACAMLGALATWVMPHVPAIIWLPIGTFVAGVFFGVHLESN